MKAQKTQQQTQIDSPRRRQCLKIILASMLAGLPQPSAWANTQPIFRKIPHGGEQLPVIGLGTSRTFDVDPEFIDSPIKEVLRLFVEHGGRVVDSSPMYGYAEEVTGKLANELTINKQLFYATKVWVQGREHGILQMRQSMQRLKTDVIDLMQIHNLVDWRTHIKTLREWKQQGLIRYIGITHYLVDYFDDLEQIMKTEDIDFVQLPYSIVTRDAEDRLLPLAQEKGIAVLVNRPFEKAELFRLVRGKDLPEWAREFDCQSWAQFYLKFILSHPAVTCPIPATSKVKHLVDNMQAGIGRLPDQTTRQKMIQFIRER